MRIDGKAFRNARKKIRAKNPGRGKPNDPAKGTQEWLADEAGVSLRALQKLEHGEATPRTIKAVSKELKIENWEEYLLDYGLEYLHCTATGVVDFRPEQHPIEYPETFMESTLMVSIDPLSILADSGNFDSFCLRSVNFTLSGLAKPIEFNWLAEVSLTPEAKGWLGWVKEIEDIYVTANDRAFNIPIMFKQESIPHISWATFVRWVEDSQKSQFDIEVRLCFLRFEKNFNIHISIDLLKILFEKGREKYNSTWPYRSQIRAIV